MKWNTESDLLSAITLQINYFLTFNSLIKHLRSLVMGSCKLNQLSHQSLREHIQSQMSAKILKQSAAFFNA